jgi:hypothetical protein
MIRKPIQVDEKTHEVIRREAIRLNFVEPNRAITMAEVVKRWAQKVNKKQKYVESF